jgi:excisionase family DNA binding protein
MQTCKNSPSTGTNIVNHGDQFELDFQPSGNLPKTALGAPPWPEHLYLTKLQVAQMFQVTVRTLDDWMKRGLIPFIKVGRTVRFRADLIDSCVRANLLVSRRSFGKGGRHA